MINAKCIEYGAVGAVVLVKCCVVDEQCEMRLHFIYIVAKINF